MIDIGMTVRVRAVLLAALTACAACGGGGGSGGGTVVGGVSPPPPPVAPPPPVPVVTARASANATSVQEGQPFKLDASTSTEAGGAALTYAWTQVSGPTVTITTPTSAMLNLNAAEVTADAPAQFRVTATSGSVSAAATVDVTFTNIAQTPVFGGGPRLLSTATFATPPRKTFGEYNYAMVGLAAGPEDAQTFIELTTSTSGELQVGAASQLENLPAATILKVSSAPFGAGTERYFTLIEEATDTFRVMTRSTTGQIGTKYSYTVDDPCGFSHAITQGQLGYYVGRRQGFTVFRANTLPPVNVGTFNMGKPHCALVAPRLSISGATFSGPAPNYYDVIALDQTANTLTQYNDPAFTATPSYVEKVTVPVQLNATKPLRLASWTEVGLNGGLTFNTAMAMVFTDGEHNGEHRLVIVGLDAGRNLIQRTYNLGLGVPIQVFVDNMNGDAYQPEIVVLKSTSPQLEIYEPTVTSGAADPLAGPFFVEVGLGASSATRMRTMVGMNGTMIAFPNKKQIKLLDVPPS